MLLTNGRKVPTTIELLARDTYRAGDLSLDAIPIARDVTEITISIDRVALSRVTLRMAWSIELSLDAGRTWLPWGAAETTGGDIINPRTGLSYLESNFTVTLPEPENPDRQLRGQVSISEDADISVTVTTRP